MCHFCRVRHFSEPCGAEPFGVTSLSVEGTEFSRYGFVEARPGGRSKRGVGGMRAIVMSAAVVIGTLAYLMVGAALAGMG
jgi:hypothetical protein